MKNIIKSNVEHIQARIEAAAERVGRDPAGVTLLPVTKMVGLEEVRAL